MRLKIKGSITKKGKNLYKCNYLSGITIAKNSIINQALSLLKGFLVIDIYSGKLKLLR